MVRVPYSLSAALAILFAAGPSSAHHEAIFGPQSSLVLSSPEFISLQAFSRRFSTGVQETTPLLSFGFTPVAGLPLSFTAIVPATDRGGKWTREDMILGSRYLQRLGGAEGNFLMGVAAIEPPTGNTDHPSFDGSFIFQGAALASAERGPFSGIAYGYWRSSGNRKPENLFFGSGLAWTPIDDGHGHLFSAQLGASYEISFDVGNQLLLHPTIVFAPGGSLLFFAVVSLPVHRHMTNPALQDDYRLGAGAIFLFGGAP
jgi:hypothetical protein